jgi:8-oxo-dGTP pyrophosphatase MutT (NUDIX family)
MSCRDEILIVPSDRIQEVQTGGAGSSVRLPADVFVNLNPYLPPRRVDAGGGFVVRQTDTTEPEILMIFRRGVWDLPKGKQDANESIEACALREVREELGISALYLLAALGTTIHGYPEKGRYRVKTTHWFLMRTSEQRFTPQAEEDIERVAWMPYAEAVERVGFITLRAHMVRVRPLVFEHLDV